MKINGFKIRFLYYTDCCFSLFQNYHFFASFPRFFTINFHINNFASFCHINCKKRAPDHSGALFKYRTIDDYKDAPSSIME